jgi:hypothetical protein
MTGGDRVRETTEGRVLVAFTGQVGLWWLRLLRPGFRHCYALIECEDGWVICNPASHWTEIRSIGRPPLVDLLDWLFTGGAVVAVWRRTDVPKRVAPVRPYSCVEEVKRLLGLRAPGVFTPWQLYRYLTRPPREKFRKPKKILDKSKNTLYISRQ